MINIRDYTESLKDDIARQSAALSVMARVSSFVDDLEGRGFGVSAEVDPVAVGVVRVSLKLECPAGEVDLGAVEIVEVNDKHSAGEERSPAEAVRRFGEVVKSAQLPDQKRKPGPITAKQGPRWSDREKADLIDMVARGVVPQEISRRLGRPLPATRKMITKLAAQGTRPRRKSVQTADAPQSAPAAVPKPTPEIDPDPAGATAAATVARVVPAFSPLDTVDASQATVKMFEVHLLWLYRGALDADQIACDLEMVELLLSTGSAQVVAQEFDWPKSQVVDRWHVLRHGHPVTLDLQQKLLEALRSLSKGVR